MLAAGSPELEYKDWLCCWWGCVGMDYDSAAASEEAVGSLRRGEVCDVPWGCGTTRLRKLEGERGSCVSLLWAAEPC